MKNVEKVENAGVACVFGGGGSLKTSLLKGLCYCGFTMAEILLSLTIIGVVAAITLPSLTGNINERTWNTQRKALHARMSQAVSLMPSLNGYGYTGGAGSSSAATADTAAETFLTAGLSKVLKINNICDAEHIADCGIPDRFTTMKGSSFELSANTKIHNYIDGGTYNVPNTNAAAFETANGESMLVYYNPYCRIPEFVPNTTMFSNTFVCASFIYDLNGRKGPNTVGKDVGIISVISPFDSFVVAPMPLSQSSGTHSFTEARKICSSVSEEARLPNIYEGIAISFNQKILGTDGLPIWLSTKTDNGLNCAIAGAGDMACDDGSFDSNSNYLVHCIKR